ncbi:NADH dehydrogenase (ubiquinone) B14.5 B subunit [Andrena cerasifolii]|uniref:NADH dehydrogenase (ubiquinone) B14.5 B subunit n=1 Tax=Andrena cerasifolii TaxID=2819439 RepID=UPI00403827C9
MGEVGENPAQWAIDIFEGKNYHYERRFYNKYTGEILGGLIGSTSPWIRNYMLNRPFNAGLQYHIAFGIVGVVLGRILTVTTDQYYAKRDAILLDYIKKHPQRFPEPRNKKYADLLLPWTPVR